jgi:hypothetical protein
LEESFWRNQVRQTADGLAHMTAAFDSDRSVTDHERTWRIVDVDEKTIRFLIGRKQLANRFAERLVIARHHQHRDSLTIVLGCPNDEMAQNARQSRPCCADAGAHQTIAQRERNAVAARAMDRAFLDGNDPIRSALEMSHYKTAPTRSWTENKSDLLPEAPDAFGIHSHWYE